MESLITKKKEKKRESLLNSAYELFMDKGISNTTIDQICRKAGIAKGTFYLYFHDKEDILKSLIKRISYTLLQNAYARVNKNRSFIENLVQMADYLIDYFKNDTGTVQVLKKDFTWPITEEEFISTDDPLMSSIRDMIEQYSESSGLEEHKILLRIYALFSMIASVCYSAIIDHFPDDIDMFKPEIFSMIRGSFNKD